MPGVVDDTDLDMDGIGDSCDPDIDGDGVQPRR
ncbi:MAG: thrombospondin type 3 repeat-containing protein [Myxococcota bacterium]